MTPPPSICKTPGTFRIVPGALCCLRAGFPSYNLSVCFADKAGLRHPASAALRLRLAGRCPNNDSLFPPLAVVVVVAPSRGASGEEIKLSAMPKPPLLGEVARRRRDGEVGQRRAYPWIEL